MSGLPLAEAGLPQPDLPPMVFFGLCCLLGVLAYLLLQRIAESLFFSQRLTITQLLYITFLTASLLAVWALVDV